MRTLAILVATVALSVSQNSAQPFAGTWTAEFSGQTFVRLELKVVDGAIGGGLSLGDIQLDKQGAVRRAGALPPGLTPLIDIKQRGATLTFARKDGNDTDHFELRLLDGGDGELTFVPSDADRKDLTELGIPTIKPFRLKKT